MAKGYLAGVIWGLVVSVVGASALSLAVGPPSETQTAAAPDEAPIATFPDDPAPEALPGAETATDPASPAPEERRTAAQLPDTPPVRFEENTEAAPDSAPAPPAPARRPSAETDVAEPRIGALEAPGEVPDSAMTNTDTAPGTMPDASLDSSAPPVPDAAPTAGGVAVTTEAPVLPSVQAALPAAPGSEREPSVATEPAQPPQPSVPPESSGLVSDPEAQPESAPEAASQPESDTDAAPEPTAQPEPTARPETETPPQTAQDTAPEAAPSEDAAPQADTTVRILTAPSSSDSGDRPGVGTPAMSLADRTAPEGRLPTVIDPEETATAPSDPQQASPLDAYAADVAVAEDVPRIAIILIDDGSGPLGPDAFDAFPFPVTFALDPAQPGTAVRMQGYRANGLEVLTLASVPEGAQPSDVEVTLQASLAAVPEAVGVLETPGGGLQGSRAVSDQLSQALRATGHGLVLQDNGLNTAASLAARDGVPVATIFKDFDGSGQDPRAIRRFLDGAAFRARRDGTAVVMGRLSADTLSAVLLWGLQDRSGQLALVPVSHVLRNPAN